MEATEKITNKEGSKNQNQTQLGLQSCVGSCHGIEFSGGPSNGMSDFFLVDKAHDLGNGGRESLHLNKISLLANKEQKKKKKTTLLIPQGEILFFFFFKEATYISSSYCRH